MTEPVLSNNADNGPHHDDSERLDSHMRKLAEEQFRRQMRQAAFLLSKGNGHDALPLLEKCYSYRPEDADVLTNLGGAYILSGKHHHAVPILERASELAPENPAIWSNLAAAYLGKLVTSTGHKQTKALEAYQRVIEIDPAYPNVHYNMGLIYIDRREWDAAHNAFTRAIETNPHDTDAHNMRRRVREILDQPPSPTNN